MKTLNRKDLAVKKTNLETANKNANLKLQIMVKGQNEAEQKKRKSTEMKAKLEIQQKKCAEKKAEVEEDLSKVSLFKKTNFEILRLYSTIDYKTYIFNKILDMVQNSYIF